MALFTVIVLVISAVLIALLGVAVLVSCLRGPAKAVSDMAGSINNGGAN